MPAISFGFGGLVLSMSQLEGCDNYLQGSRVAVNETGFGDKSADAGVIDFDLSWNLQDVKRVKCGHHVKSGPQP